VAQSSIVEFGSDVRYLQGTRVPEPATGMLAVALLAMLRRRG
jgi:MYXO-CTERM domain-containing protein